MIRRREDPPNSGILRSLAALACGLTVLVLLVPDLVLHVFPPLCYSTFGYRVPCGVGRADSFAIVAAVATVAIAWAALKVRARRRRTFAEV